MLQLVRLRQSNYRIVKDKLMKNTPVILRVLAKKVMEKIPEFKSRKLF